MSLSHHPEVPAAGRTPRAGIVLNLAVGGLLVAFLAVGLIGCSGDSGGDAAAEADRTSLQRLANDALVEVRRIEGLLSQPWLAQLPFRKRLYGRKTAMQGWLDSTAAYLEEGSSVAVPKSLIDRGEKLAAAVDENWVAATGALEKLGPVASAVHETRRGIERALQNGGWTDEDEVPLRDVTFRQGYLPRVEQAFKDLADGINAVVLRGDDVKVNIGAAALVQANREGPELHQRLEKLVRDFHESRTRMAMARDTQTKGRAAVKKMVAAIEAGGDGAPSQELLEEVQGALRQLDEALPAIEKRLTGLRAGLLKEQTSAKEELGRVIGDLDALRGDVIKPLLPVASKLGIDLKK